MRFFLGPSGSGPIRNKRAAQSAILIRVGLLVLVTLSLHGSARPEFQSEIPNGANVPGYQRLGHVTEQLLNNQRNGFGIDFAAADYQWTTELCMKDSDNDGFSNGYELGDPDCAWTKQSPTQLRTTDLTHPGLSSSRPNTANPAPTAFENITPAPGMEKDPIAEYVHDLFIAHAILMSIAFGLFLPLAVIIPAVPSLRATTFWFDLHRLLVAGLFILAWIGFLIAMFGLAFENRNLQDMLRSTPTIHGPLGISIMTILTFQALLGAFRPHLPRGAGEPKSPFRVAFEYVHPFFGRSIVVLAAVQMFYGFRLLTDYHVGNDSSVMAWAYFQAIAMPIGVLSLVLLLKLTTSKSTSAQPSSNSIGPHALTKNGLRQNGNGESLSESEVNVKESIILV